MFGRSIRKYIEENFVGFETKMADTYTVSYSHYLSIRKDDDWETADSYFSPNEIFVGTRKECINYLKIQLLDAATKLIDLNSLDCEFLDYRGSQFDCDFAESRITVEFYDSTSDTAVHWVSTYKMS